jgi:hypothetical protein
MAMAENNNGRSMAHGNENGESGVMAKVIMTMA